MKFNYFKKTGELYRGTLQGKEYDGDDGYNFEYEPSQEKFEKELKTLVVNDYGESAWKLIADFGLFEDVGAGYKDELKEIFEQEAQLSEDRCWQ